MRNCLKHSRVKDLVYIYINSRLLRHRRGPNPARWYRLNMIHSDNDLDGNDQDDDKDHNWHEGGDDIDNNDTKSMDFYNDNLDLGDSHSNGNDGGGDGDFTIFDFNEEVMILPNEARHVDHEGSIEGPSFGSLSAKQGFWHEHNVAMVAPTATASLSASTSELHLQPQSQHRPLTQSIANISMLVVPHEIAVGSTLVATHNILRNVGREASCCLPIPSASISPPRGQFTGKGGVGLEVVSRGTSVKGTEVRGVGFGGGCRARDATTINDASTSQNESQSVPCGNATNDSTRN